MRVGPDRWQSIPAYPYPCGSASVGWLYRATDEDLRRLSVGRVRDQAISLDGVVAEYLGRWRALRAVLAHYPEAAWVPEGAWLLEEEARTRESLERLEAQQERLRRLLEAVWQPSRDVECAERKEGRPCSSGVVRSLPPPGS